MSVKLTDPNTNQEKIERIELMLRKIYEETLERGFFGSVQIEFAVQDGTIQSYRRRIEQTCK